VRRGEGSTSAPAPFVEQRACHHVRRWDTYTDLVIRSCPARPHRAAKAQSAQKLKAGSSRGTNHVATCRESISVLAPRPKIGRLCYGLLPNSLRTADDGGPFAALALKPPLSLHDARRQAACISLPPAFPLLQQAACRSARAYAVPRHSCERPLASRWEGARNHPTLSKRPK
jgi:hypothetical protein